MFVTQKHLIYIYLYFHFSFGDGERALDNTMYVYMKFYNNNDDNDGYIICRGRDEVLSCSTGGIIRIDIIRKRDIGFFKRRKRCIGPLNECVHVVIVVFVVVVIVGSGWLKRNVGKWIL